MLTVLLKIMYLSNPYVENKRLFTYFNIIFCSNFCLTEPKQSFIKQKKMICYSPLGCFTVFEVLNRVSPCGFLRICYCFFKDSTYLAPEKVI